MKPDARHPSLLRRSSAGKSRGRRVSVRENGSVAIEFVIVLPFMLLVLVGIIDVTLMLYDKAAIANAARVAARAGTCVSVPPLTTSQVSATATAALNGVLVSGKSSNVPTVTVNQSNGTTTGSPLSVTVSYPYQGLFVGSAFTTLTGPISLSATAVMNYE
ncbi:TadE/TadG family type IV pilus assembly protein [Caballeronia sp. ATUFL_M2_KS44]|uniref:TadE family protein n=1 Tax=Caballeronia sp. ATUFL_M2_KS44 TaxID=2921767 RepID=UPI002540FEB7|nr:TadE/TadG family type IV pilus assembly protein [Caballeronia sp. ATUFL_M2_KS44]